MTKSPIRTCRWCGTPFEAKSRGGRRPTRCSPQCDKLAHFDRNRRSQGRFLLEVERCAGCGQFLEVQDTGLRRPAYFCPSC